MNQEKKSVGPYERKTGDIGQLAHQMSSSIFPVIKSNVGAPGARRGIVMQAVAAAARPRPPLRIRHPERPPRVQLTYGQQGPLPRAARAGQRLGFGVAQTAGKLFGMSQGLHAHVEGSGIGPCMGRKMVENSGGRDEVQSQPGSETSFLVFISVHPKS